MAETTGMQVSRTQGMSPIRMPRAMPGRAPRANPTPIRARLILRFAQSSPLCAVPQAAMRMSVGAGKKRTSMRCARASASQMARMRSGERRESPLGGRGGMAPSVDTEEVPDAGDVATVLGILPQGDDPPGPRERDVDRAQDPPRRRGHYDHAIAEGERF